MIELELLGTSGDGGSLVFTDADGQRYSVLITDELRGATRRDRPRMEVAAARPSLAPREIQALLRSGATAQEIASRHGMEVATVARFEAPVQAEKEYALSRALGVRIGDEAGGPAMGDLVVDRLAARGVDPDSLRWSAQREAHEPWQIILTFVQGAAEHGAHWRLLPSGEVEAVDQEAQWLTETVAPAPAATSIFASMTRACAVDANEEEIRKREALVDQLNAARGKRQQIEIDFDDEVDEEAEYLAAISEEEHREPREPPAITGPISAQIYSLAHARTRSAPPAPPVPVLEGTGIPSAVPQASGEIPVIGHREAPAADSNDGEGAEPGKITPGAGEVPSASGQGVPPSGSGSSRASVARRAPSAPRGGEPGASPARAGAPPLPDAEAKPDEDATKKTRSIAGGRESAAPESARPTAAGTKRTRRGRRPMPSWDEILFGTRP